jgi:hypothetical protein
MSCSFADLPVQFPAPTAYLAEYKRTKNQISQWIETNVVDPAVSPVFAHPATIKATNAIREVQIILQSEAYKKDISNDIYFPANHTLPIFHNLLSMLDHERSLLQEGLRLAAMLFVHELQQMYWGLIPPPLLPNKLHRVLSHSDLDWLSQDPTLFWIIAVALTSGIATVDQKAFFICKFELLVNMAGISNFDGVLRRVAQISWDNGVLKTRTEVLRSHFEEICKRERGNSG